MQSKRQHFIDTLEKFAPAAFTPYLADCILSAGVQFKIVPGRKTKLTILEPTHCKPNQLLPSTGTSTPIVF